MNGDTRIGLGELLRHLSDLLDRDAERIYARLVTGLEYRARYTPIMRALAHGPLSVTELQRKIRISQGAVSQTAKLMQADGLLHRTDAADRRMRKLALTNKGEALRQRLAREWALHLDAIADLEAETGAALRSDLISTIAALERIGFEQRIEALRGRRDDDRA